jgi:hypothetical protein
MALLLSATSSAPGEYYFAPASGGGGGGGVVIAESFEAIGTLAPLTPGKYVAHIPPGANALRIETPLPASLARWGIGVDGVEAGANSGSDFTINRYDDAGALLQVPLSIERSSGILTTMGNATIGDGSAVGGAVLNINGLSGPGRVYDTVYNLPPVAAAGTEVVNNSYGPTGTLITSLTYTPAVSGLFSVTMEVSVDSAALAWTNGTSLIVGYMGSPFPPFPVNADSYLACDSVANPAGFPFPVPGTVINGIYKKDMVALVNLTAGIQYAAQATFSAGINLGTTGGVTFYIQPILA